MRLLFAAIVLTTTTALAGPPKPMMLNVHAGPATIRYSAQQSAVAAQKLLNLQFPPTLGQSISLTPGAPTVPGIAELDFLFVDMIAHGNLWSFLYGSGSPAGGFADITFGDPKVYYPNIQITLAGRAGQRYFVDCRADEGTSDTALAASPVSYEIFINTGNPVTGTVPLRSDGHFVFGIPSSPTNAKILIRIRKPMNDAIRFYGCDISPF
jgi:hypothetical protein